MLKCVEYYSSYYTRDWCETAYIYHLEWKTVQIFLNLIRS